jgi:hypothetical protein
MTPRNCSRNLEPFLGALLLASALLGPSAGCNGSFAFDAAAVAGSGGHANAEGGAQAAGGSAFGGSAGGATMAVAGTGGLAGAPIAFGTCAKDRDCGLPSLHCNVSSMRCVECLNDGQCPAARPACLPETGTCAACSVLVDCAAGQLCDLQTNKCLFLCTSDADCDDPHSSCNNSGFCQVCDDKDDCSVALGGNYCQRSAGACVQCLDNSQCHGKTPLCALPSGLCVACADSSDCGKSAPFCDPFARVCSAAIDE